MSMVCMVFLQANVSVGVKWVMMSFQIEVGSTAITSGCCAAGLCPAVNAVAHNAVKVECQMHAEVVEVLAAAIETDNGCT
jgi:hypothetical protein